jgi:hypothetical protein
MPFFICVVAISMGCSDDITQTALSRVVITTTKQIYLPGEQIFVTLSNESGRTLFLNRCVGELQHREGNTWRLISSRGCIPEMVVSQWRPFGPAQMVADSQATAIVFQTGEYRMMFDVRVDTIGAPPFEANVSSNVFHLE